MIPVVWLSYHEDCPTRGYWDQGCFEALLAGKWGALPYQFEHMHSLPEHSGAIVCLPAKAHEGDIERLNADLEGLPWVLLVLSEDECGDFDYTRLTHPNMRVWVQTPWPGRYAGGTPWMVGYRGDTTEILRDCKADYMAKPHDWSFSGQISAC